MKNTTEKSANSQAVNVTATSAVSTGRAYVWPAEAGKFRGAKARFEQEAGFKAYSSIEFRADNRLVYTLAPIPAKWPTLGTAATRATVMLTTSCTYEQAKAANAGPGDGRNLGTAKSGQFKLALDGHGSLLLSDTATGAVAYMDKTGRTMLVYGPQADPCKLLGRAKRLVADFVLNGQTSALLPYIPKTATAKLVQSDGRVYQADIPADADIRAARAAIILLDDGHLNLAELANVVIASVAQSEFEAWLAES